MSETGEGLGGSRNRRSERRRRRPRARVFDNSVPSPCISVCQVDNARGWCIGCFRTIDEIRDWPILSAAQKTAVLEHLPARKAEAKA